MKSPAGQSSAQERRLREIDEAARNTIVRNGLKDTTLRDIAREGGFTTGVLMHYFADKDSLISWVFANTFDRWITRARSALSERSSAEDLLKTLVDLGVPNSEEERREWRVWVELWRYAADNPDFARGILETDELWEAEVRSVLERAVAEGLLPPSLDATVHARIYARLVDGIGGRSVVDDKWAEARQLLITHLEALRVAAPMNRQEH